MSLRRWYCHVVGVFLLGASCSSINNSELAKLKEYLDSHSVSTDSLSAVLVLSDQGCPKCNRAFALFCADHLNDPSVCVLSTASGLRFDIGELLQDTTRILWVDQRDVTAFGISEGSGIILMAQGRIDTIIHIKASDLEPTLAYLQTRLSQAH